MALKVYVNTQGVNDLPFSTNPSDFTEMDLAADKLIFSAGSVTVADGQPIPTVQELNSAGLLIGAADVECPHFFLADVSAVNLKEIHNAGNQNKRYVFCASFDAATASEPILELWDDANLDTIADYCLGNEIAGASFFRAKTTTGALPGVGWTGNRMAGSAETHFLWLNDGAGALSAAKELYWNLRLTIPALFGNAAAEAPVWVIKYTSN